MQTLFRVTTICCLALLTSGCTGISSPGTDLKDSGASSPSPAVTQTENLGPVATQSPTSTPSAAPRTVVIWADYSSGLQEQLDAMTASQDCIGIQSFYGMTAATEESMKASTGHGNDALNAYIAESLKLAQCG